MSSPVAGWYPDPSGEHDERWWNGVSWSDSTRAATTTATPAPTVPSAGVPQTAAVPGQTPPPYQPSVPTGGGYPGANPTPPPGAAPASPYPPAGYGGYGAFGGPAARPPQTASFAQRNSFSLGVVGVVILYGLILYFAHFVILGILPLFLSFRALARKEPLAVPAVVLGILALISGIYFWTR